MPQPLTASEEFVVNAFRGLRGAAAFAVRVAPTAIAIALLLALLVQVQALGRRMEEVEAHVKGQEIVNRRVHAELGIPPKSFAERLEEEYGE